MLNRRQLQFKMYFSSFFLVNVIAHFFVISLKHFLLHQNSGLVRCNRIFVVPPCSHVYRLLILFCAKVQKLAILAFIFPCFIFFFRLNAHLVSVKQETC